MNKVMLSGRLTRDVDLRQTSNGKSVCMFALAVDRRNASKEADFPTIIAWDKLAEFVTKCLGKGRRVIVEGNLRTRKYTDKDTQKTIFATEVIAERIEFDDIKPSGDDVYNESTEYESSFGG